jgi:pimeloyl-ACP methyl ester carboxylesterase
VTKIAQGFGNKVVLVGFSLGGILSIQQAKATPKMVAGYLAMAPSFHGGDQLPHSELSCLARNPLIRGIAEGVSGQNLSNDFILGGCAIFRVSKQITSNIQNSLFANYNKGNSRFQDEKLRAKNSME